MTDHDKATDLLHQARKALIAHLYQGSTGNELHLLLKAIEEHLK